MVVVSVLAFSLENVLDDAPAVSALMVVCGFGVAGLDDWGVDLAGVGGAREGGEAVAGMGAGAATGAGAGADGFAPLMLREIVGGGGGAWDCSERSRGAGGGCCCCWGALKAFPGTNSNAPALSLLMVG